MLSADETSIPCMGCFLKAIALLGQFFVSPDSTTSCKAIHTIALLNSSVMQRDHITIAKRDVAAIPFVIPVLQAAEA